MVLLWSLLSTPTSSAALVSNTSQSVSARWNTAAGVWLDERKEQPQIVALTPKLDGDRTARIALRRAGGSRRGLRLLRRLDRRRRALARPPRRGGAAAGEALAAGEAGMVSGAATPASGPLAGAAATGFASIGLTSTT